jgi:hypothetical protein
MRIVIAALASLIVGTCLLTGAPGRAGEDNHPAGDHAGGELTQAQAAALVQQRYAARVIRASSADEGGRRIYVFRLLSQAGKVWEVHVDARSGMEVR